MKKIKKPIREIVKNTRFRKGSKMYQSYEISTVQEFSCPEGTNYFDSIVTQEDLDKIHSGEYGDTLVGPVVVGVYGQDSLGHSEHIKDFSDYEHALEFLRKIGVLA